MTAVTPISRSPHFYVSIIRCLFYGLQCVSFMSEWSSWILPTRFTIICTRTSLRFASDGLVNPISSPSSRLWIISCGSPYPRLPMCHRSCVVVLVCSVFVSCSLSRIMETFQWEGAGWENMAFVPSSPLKATARMKSSVMSESLTEATLVHRDMFVTSISRRSHHSYLRMQEMLWLREYVHWSSHPMVNRQLLWARSRGSSSSVRWSCRCLIF